MMTMMCEFGLMWMSTKAWYIDSYNDAVADGDVMMTKTLIGDVGFWLCSFYINIKYLSYETLQQRTDHGIDRTTLYAYQQINYRNVY